MRTGLRIRTAQAVGLLVFLALAGRAAQLSAADPRSHRLRENQVQARLRLAPERGAIVDRRGRELAVSVRSPSVYVMPGALRDRREAIAALARALDLPRERVARRLRGRRGFTFVARWVDAERARAVEDLELPGVAVLDEARRAYPSGPLAAPVIGFANIDGHGVRGIEEQEDAWLRGRDRVVPVERDGSGRLLAIAGVDGLDAAGGDVALTLDARMQAAAEEALSEAVAAAEARGGLAITMDPRSGDVLASAQRPGFDPNRFREVPFADTRARAFTDLVEPGSTLKAFLVAAALEAGAIEPDSAVDCSGGELPLPGKTIRDARDFGLLDPAGVLRVSSNVGAVHIAEGLGAAAHHAALRRFGFGTATGSGFPAEAEGLLRAPERWRRLDHATVAFGQGLSVTGIQLAAATAALGNGGVWMRPRLVAGRRPARGSWHRTRPIPERRVLSEDTAARVLEMLEGVVSGEGTGRLAGLRGVRVAGKTGTAQKLDRESGRYSHKRYVAWFIGLVPADDPRLAIVVAVDEPGGRLHSGGSVAAPLFAEIASRQLAVLGIHTKPEPRPRPPMPTGAPPEPEPAPAAETRVVQAPSPAREPVVGNAEAVVGFPPVSAGPPGTTPGGAARPPDELVNFSGRILLPDFRGLSPEEVVRITARHRVRLQTAGSGRAVEQDPRPGTILEAADARVWVRFAASGPGEG